MQPEPKKMDAFKAAKKAARQAIKAGRCVSAAHLIAMAVVTEHYPGKDKLIQDLAWQAVLAAR